MSENFDVRKFVENPELLEDLCRRVIQSLSAEAEMNPAREMEAQLREISRTIDRLSKVGVSIPEALEAEKIRLTTELTSLTTSIGKLTQLSHIFDALLSDIRGQIGHKQPVGHSGHSRLPRGSRTSGLLIRDWIIETLVSAGGAAYKDEVFETILKTHRHEMVPADFDLLPDGKRVSWENSAEWQATYLRKENRLKSNSPRGLWELSNPEE